MELIDTMNYSDVINWVSVMHDRQYRKGTEIPYVAHVLGVALSLISEGIEDKSIIFGALLHDVVEDTSVTIETVRELYGETVSEYVSCLSEDKDKSWEERKQFAIEHTNLLPIGAKWIKLADKVNSLEMMASEIKIGMMDWGKFNRSYLHQKWYYSRLLSELKRDPIISASKLFHHAEKLLQTVFGNVHGVMPAKELGINGEGEKTIYVGEGILLSGWFYSCEFWAVDQVSNFTYYFDKNIVSNTDKDFLVRFLENEKLVTFYGDKKYVAVGEMIDQKGQSILSLNIVIGDDEDLFADAKSLINRKL